MKIVFKYCFIITIIIGCTTKYKPIEVNKMKQIIWELSMVDEFIKINTFKDSLKLKVKENTSLYNKVFANFKTTKTEFYKSIEFYKKDPEAIKMLIDSASAFGTRKKDTIVNHIK
jgi:Domain of unknown function (DUF4296)